MSARRPTRHPAKPANAPALKDPHPRPAATIGLPRFFADKPVIDRIVVPIGDPNAYAAQAHGNCMAPLLRDGDVIVFSPALAVRKGMIIGITFVGGSQPIVKRMAHDLRTPHPGDEITPLLALETLNPPDTLFLSPAVVDSICVVAGVVRDGKWIPLPAADASGVTS